MPADVVKRSWSARVVILAASGLVIGLAFAGSVLTSLADLTQDQEELAEQSAPALAALHDVETAALDAQAALERMAQATTDADRGLAIAEAQAARTVMDRAWRNYGEHALGAPGEEELRMAYSDALSRGDEFGVALVSTARGSPDYEALLVAERTAAGEQRAVVDEIVSTIYAPAVRQGTQHVLDDLEEARQLVLVVAGTATILYSGVALGVGHRLRREQREMLAATRRMQEVGDQVDFEATLQRGLEMAHTEPSVFTVAGRALESVADTHEVEVLMRSGRGSRLQRVLAIGGGEGCGCCDASDCPAATRGQVTIAADSRAVDACPLLDAGDGRAVWAACIPVAYAGAAEGVIHVQGALDAVDAVTPDLLVQRLQIVARRMGERIGGLRLLRQSEQHARTDPLTGLANRRSLDIAIQEALVPGVTPYTVAFADLDHFKALNDVAGHDAGDRALRLFARVLRDSTRPGDIVGRYGGEEFVVVFPDCDLTEAVAAAERIRANLASALQQSDVPSFTATIGLASARTGESFEDVVKRADAALLLGKAHGRDQVVAEDLAPAAEVLALHSG